MKMKQRTAYFAYKLLEIVVLQRGLEFPVNRSLENVKIN